MCFYCRPNCLNHLLEAAPLSAEWVPGTVLSFCQIATATCHQQHFKIIESKSMLQFYPLSLVASFPYKCLFKLLSCKIKSTTSDLVGGGATLILNCAHWEIRYRHRPNPSSPAWPPPRRQKPRWRRRREQRPDSTGSTRRRVTPLTTLWELSGMLKRISNDQFKPLCNAHCQCIAIQMLCFNSML